MIIATALTGNRNVKFYSSGPLI